MEAILGVVAFIGGLALINWAIHAFLKWTAELARRGRRPRPPGGNRRFPPHPRPGGHPTGRASPSRTRGADRQRVRAAS